MKSSKFNLATFHDVRKTISVITILFHPRPAGSYVVNQIAY
jgi:hypothetical protein